MAAVHIRAAETFRALLEDHARAVLGYALRRTHDPADAADAVAETFLVVWRRLEDAPFGRETRPWLFGVARRTLANQRRVRRAGRRWANAYGARWNASFRSAGVRLTGGESGEQAWAAAALHVANTAPRLLIDAPGWKSLAPGWAHRRASRCHAEPRRLHAAPSLVAGCERRRVAVVNARQCRTARRPGDGCCRDGRRRASATGIRHAGARRRLRA